MRKAILNYQAAHNANIADPSAVTGKALNEARENLMRAAIDCDASKLPDDAVESEEESENEGEESED